MKKALLVLTVLAIVGSLVACGASTPDILDTPVAVPAVIEETPAPTPSPEDRYAEAKALVDDGDYTNGIPALKTLAEEGYGPAMGLLGLCYEAGAGVDADVKTAFDWYEKAAEAKDPTGYAGLGHLYYVGKTDADGNVVIAKDADLAVKNLLLAVAFEEQRSYGDLAAAYLTGTGVDYRPDVAFTLCTVASRDGSPAHLTDLGSLYYYGDSFGIKKNVPAARQCFTQAAASDYAQAQYYLGVLSYYEDRDYETAYHWYDLAAKQGNADAQLAMGMMNYNGEFVKRNYNEAFRLTQLAANQGDAPALYQMGLLYEKGQGTIICLPRPPMQTPQRKATPPPCAASACCIIAGAALRATLKKPSSFGGTPPRSATKPRRDI